MGMCIDDLGTEDIKNHYGNKKNVIGDLIELKYAKKTTGIYLHGTTNLTAEQLKDFYGSRVTSRMREIFNLSIAVLIKVSLEWLRPEQQTLWS